MEDRLSVDTTVVIVGASAAGLATAAHLKRAGIEYVLLEQSDRVGARWRGHYDRLHLHTIKRLSGLPFHPMPKDYPRYPSRDQFVGYLEDYAKSLSLAPRFNQQVASVEQDDGGWIIRTQDAACRSRFVVVATGYARAPYMPSFPGQDEFTGVVMHSRDYRNGAAYTGQSAVVVGFGNSAGEIALDLAEHGASTALAVRQAVNVVPRDILGIPVQAISAASPGKIPAVSDFLFAPLIRLTIGDIRKTGLRKLPYGPRQQIARDRRIPLIDIGTMQAIRDGRITVYPGIERFTTDSAVFEDGRILAVDLVILATGFRPALHDFLPAAAHVTDENGVPVVSGGESSLPGLYFCGFFVAPAGMLREIAKEAQQIARAIQSRTTT
jgi:indole-3-pyruvate monooxygenase